MPVSAKPRKPRPTGNAVHRYSKTRVGQEGPFFQPINRRNARRLMAVARRYDQGGRIDHRRARSRAKIGRLGHVALDVLYEMLFHFMNRATGRLDPGYNRLAARTGHAKSAVFDAVQRLRELGFLARLRRYVETGMQGLRGPQVAQATNAYQLRLPKTLSDDYADAPLPDDDAWRRGQDRAEFRRMLDGLPLDKLPGAIVSDSGLAAALARLGALLEGG